MGKRKMKDTDVVKERAEKRRKQADDEFSSFIGCALNAEEMGEMRKKEEKVRLSLRSFPPALLTTASASTFKLDVNRTFDQLGWNEGLIANTSSFLEASDKDSAERLRSALSLVGQYVDVSCEVKKGDNHEVAYCAHVLNHIIRSRTLIASNKSALIEASSAGTVTDDLIESSRDQGFVRPTVLILVPYRKDALKVGKILAKLMFGCEWEKAQIFNKARFEKEFGATETRIAQRLIEDEGENEEDNRDDCFRVGISFSRKSFKTYAPFDASDLLLCSPLGLRMIIGAEEGGESHLLSSIQIAVFDGTDVMLQQNWEHVTLIADSMHRLPTKINTDVSRVRSVYLNGHAAAVCQSLLFTRHRHELFSALMAARRNHRGSVSFKPSSHSLLSQVEIPLCQELHRVQCVDAPSQSNARFAYFKSKVWPSLSAHTAIFIPSYFDYVRIRNAMKKETESFVQCHEYAKPDKVARARMLFYKGEKKLMLITERFHHFYRYNIRKMQRLVFYQPPSNPSFYTQLINMCTPEGTLSSTLLFSQYDKIRLENIFGLEMAASILRSDKQVQAIVSE